MLVAFDVDDGVFCRPCEMFFRTSTRTAEPFRCPPKVRVKLASDESWGAVFPWWGALLSLDPDQFLALLEDEGRASAATVFAVHSTSAVSVAKLDLVDEVPRADMDLTNFRLAPSLLFSPRGLTLFEKQL